MLFILALTFCVGLYGVLFYAGYLHGAEGRGWIAFVVGVLLLTGALIFVAGIIALTMLLKGGRIVVP
jgi:hypothetical protein